MTTDQLRPRLDDPMLALVDARPLHEWDIAHAESFSSLEAESAMLSASGSDTTPRPRSRAR